MKVIHYNMRYFPLLGGIETHIDTLVRNMPDIDFEIVTDALSDVNLVERYRPNAIIHRFPPIDKMRKSKHMKLGIAMGAIRDPLREARIRKYLRQTDFDILHVHDFEKNIVVLEGMTGVRLLGDIAVRNHNLRRLGRPMLLTKHFMFTDANSTPALRRWEDRLVGQFDTIICVDKQIQYRYEVSAKRKNVLFIPNPIDIDMFKFTPLKDNDYLKIGFAGRLDAPRGENFLMEFSKRLPKNINMSMAIPHPGSRLSRIRKELSQSKIRLEIDVPYSSMPMFLEGIDVLLNPITDTYSTTRVTLEAMASGRPVIMFRDGERYPIRHGENGFLVPPDIDDVYNLLENIGEDRKSLQRIARQARSDIEQEFAAPVVASRIMQLYKEIA